MRLAMYAGVRQLLQCFASLLPMCFCAPFGIELDIELGSGLHGIL